MRFDGRAVFVSLVIPCFNEETAIAAVVRACAAQGVDEIIVVDGGSGDATVAQAGGAGARVITEPARGYGRAVAAGLKAVRSDAEIVAFMDGGGADDPAFLSAVASPAASGRSRSPRVISRDCFCALSTARISPTCRRSAQCAATGWRRSAWAR